MKELRVLIVEDDPMVADINRKFTEAVTGFVVAGTARNGQEALLLLEKEKPDLLILDVYMPEVDGVSVLSLLRKSDIPVDVIMVTAADDSKNIMKAFRQGQCEAYLTKPLDREKLITHIRDLGLIK